MKKITFLLLCFVLSFGVHAQQLNGTSSNNDVGPTPVKSDLSQLEGLANRTSRMANNVLFLEGSPDPTWEADVVNKLTAAGIPTVDLFDIDAATPTLAMLQMYDVVILSTDGAALDPVGLGNVVGQYVDAGGHVVNMMFAVNSNVGNFSIDYGLLPDANFASGSQSLGTIYDAGHPVMQGVTTFSNFVSGSGYLATGTVRPGATLLADYGDGTPLAIIAENYGASGTARMVYLNFYTPSSDTGRADFWDASTDGVALMVNSLNWAAGAVGMPPIISCPADIMADTDPGVCNAVVNFADAVAIDPDGGTVTVTQTMGPTSGSMFPTGDTIVEFTATDDEGDTATCQFTVTVTDNEAPVAVCMDITLEVDPVTGMVSIVPADVDNGSSDNCGIVDYSISEDTFTCADIGANAVTLTVTDAEGNTDSCVATVTIEDNTAPVIACIGEPATVSETEMVSPGQTIDTNGSDVTVTSTISVTDDRDILDLNVMLDVEHTWIADLEISLTSPAGTTVALFSGAADGCSADDIITTLDDESVNPFDCNPNGDGDAFPLADYIPLEALSAFDGQSTLGDWTLTIEDTFAGLDSGILNSWGFTYDYEVVPTPLDVVLDANGMATVNIADLLLNVDEACGWTATAGSMSTNSLETTFAAGNGQSGNMFDIMAVNDLTVQSFDISMDAGTTDDVEIYFKTGTWVGFDADPSAWTLVETVTGVTSAGTNVPTPLNTNLDIDVAAGETVAFYVTLVNTTNIAYTNGTTTGALFASDANLEFYEGSGNAYPFGLSFDPRVFNGNIIYDVDGVSTTMDFTCADLGENQVDITVTDDSGNTAMCTATVNILDETAPIITCGPPADVSDGASTSPGQTIDTTGSDVTISSVLSVTDDQTLNDLNVDLNINHTWIADLEITLTSPAGTSVVIFSGGADGCGSSDLVATLDDESANPLDCQAGDAFPLADYMPSNALSAFDGESTLGDWTLSITDTFPGLDGGTLNSWGITYSYPNPNPNSVIELDENGMAVVDPFDLISSVDEACGISTAAVDINEVFCSDIGTTLAITVFVSDASGNIASCVAMVDVVDAMAPELTCPADQTVDPGAGNLNYEVPDYFADGDATATDNCTDPVTITTQDPAPGTLLPDGVYTVTLTAEDEYGNVATCTFELTVESTFGVEDVLANAVSIYPNPARNVINITNGSAIGLDNATIYDVNGRLVQTIDLTNMTTEKSVDVSQLASGVYMVNIQGEGGNTIKRLIKE